MSGQGPASHMSNIHPQLPLGFEPGEIFTFDSLVTGNNAVMVDTVRKLAHLDGEAQAFVWGESGAGKSHLLQAACNYTARQQSTVCYLGHDEISQYQPAILDGLEQLDLVCLDDLDRWLDNADWQLALFDLINRIREAGHCLVMASAMAPDASFARLPDLKTRLGWGPVFQMHTLDDEHKYQALQYRASQNGLEMPEAVARYLVQRYPRDMFGLFQRLAVLDQAAMSAQRKLTIPLVRSVFEQESG